jgi:hypothetical protein
MESIAEIPHERARIAIGCGDRLNHTSLERGDPHPESVGIDIGAKVEFCLAGVGGEHRVWGACDVPAETGFI